MQTPSCCRSCAVMIKYGCKMQDVCAKVKRIKRRDSEAILNRYVFDSITRAIRYKNSHK